MTTSYFLKIFYTNTLIAGIFAFVFLSSLTQTFAQAVNPGSGQYQDTNYIPAQNYYSTNSYDTSSYNNNQNRYQQINLPISVVTYEPSYAISGSVARATLKGNVTIPFQNRGLSNVWFEWGETSALSNKTSAQSVNISYSFSANIRDLKPNTTYYYKAVAQNEMGRVEGSVISFRTPKQVVRSQEASTFFSVTPRAQASATSTSNINSGGIFGGWGSGSNANATTSSDATPTSSNTQNATSTRSGFLPGTFFGWAILALLVFIVVGFIVYLIDFYQELKTKEEEERNRRANGNGNGVH